MTNKIHTNTHIVVCVKKGTQPLKFLPVLLIYYGDETAWGRYIWSSLLVNLVPPYVRKKASNSARSTEKNNRITRARMKENSSDVKFGICFQHGILVLCHERGGEYQRLWKNVVLMFKGQGIRIIENGFKFLWGGGFNAKNGVWVVVANWII